MTPKYILQIKESLKTNVITWHQALVDLQHCASKKKPWNTKGWKQTRDKLIKNSCEQCGEKEPPMVLQHLIHPRKHQYIIGALAEEYIDKSKGKYSSELEKYLATNKKASIINKEPRNCCPSCN
jgi:hypothetical protein